MLIFIDIMDIGVFRDSAGIMTDSMKKSLHSVANFSAKPYQNEFQSHKI